MPPFTNPLDIAIQEILHRNNPRSYSVITTIERFLRQFHLSSQVEAHEILSEAYLRGTKFLQNGGTINNPYAWLKATSLNIIREQSRKYNREQLTSPELMDSNLDGSGSNHDWISQQNLANRVKMLYQALEAFKDINPEGSRLLELQAQGLSWQQIRICLIQESGTAPSEESLRQKGCRARKSLRKIYHSIAQ
ncbi:MAG: sigma-70 family RNA polymerase sigma factor [Cyanothece sp. SIO1E1]|nr:sigma-70 family RNA polymerase sigma factor [Cyanothece sp. SIO1E1]